jgi:hypothetical protein
LDCAKLGVAGIANANAVKSTPRTQMSAANRCIMRPSNFKDIANGTNQRLVTGPEALLLRLS